MTRSSSKQNLSSQEPSTRHFTPAQLSEFLEQLEAEVAERDASRRRSGVQPSRGDTRAARPLAKSSEPATVLGLLQQSSVAAPRWRVRTAPPPAPVALARPRVTSPPAKYASMVRSPVLRHARLFALGFFAFAGLVATGLLLAALYPQQRAKSAAPPPLPEIAGASEQQRAEPVPQEPSASLPSSKRDLGSAELAPTRVAQTSDARRRAADLLIAGHTRAALDAYRALSFEAPDAAVAQVVRVLERELARCQRLGSACGL